LPHRESLDPPQVGVLQHHLDRKRVDIDARERGPAGAFLSCGDEQRAQSGYVNQSGLITVGTDASVVAEIDVGGEGQMAGMRVDSALLIRGISSVGEFALAVWEAIDRREEVTAGCRSSRHSERAAKDL
jgi:hypothetical protein